MGRGIRGGSHSDNDKGTLRALVCDHYSEMWGKSSHDIHTMAWDITKGAALACEKPTCDHATTTNLVVFIFSWHPELGLVALGHVCALLAVATTINFSSLWKKKNFFFTLHTYYQRWQEARKSSDYKQSRELILFIEEESFVITVTS